MLLGVAVIILAASCSAPDPPPAEPVATPPEESAPIESSRPNVIWILMDTLRAENLSCYGYERPTSPTMDALGARGVVFENHFSQGLWTMISVPSLMTGRYFPINVIENFDYRVIHRNPPTTQQTAPEIFKQNGYATAMFTAHRLLVSEWTRLGRAFDEAYPIPNPTGAKPHGTFGDVNDRFFAWHAANPEQPFFAYLHLMDTHFPHMPTGKYAQWLNDDYNREVFGPAGPIDTEQHFAEPDIRRMAGLYDGDILYVDDQLERLLGHLEREGILENTIVVITSDHGDLLGEDGESWGHDGFSHDQIMKVPWIIAGPGVPEGVRMAGLTENVDVLPTLLDLLEFNADAAFDGTSMVPHWSENPVRSPHEYIFTRNPSKRHYDYPTSFIVRTDTFKYELDADSGEEHLWRVPDDAGARENVLDTNRAVADELKAIIEREFRPRFASYMDTEIQWILGRVGGGQSQNWHPMEAVRVVERNEQADDIGTDNLWASLPTMAGPNFLSSCGWQEDAPPVTLSYPVPAGRYHVSLELGQHALLNDRASSVSVKAENDSETAPVLFEKSDEPWFYVYGGTWNIEDGSFDIELDEGRPQDWATFRRLRMHPARYATYSFPISAWSERRRGGSPLTIYPRDAYVIRETASGQMPSEDTDRWQLVVSEDPPFQILESPAESSGGQPLSFNVPLPEGRYAVELEIHTNNGEAAALRVSVQSDETVRTIELSDAAKSAGPFVNAGVWTVADGSLDVTLVVERGSVTLFGLHCIPVSEDDQPLDPSMLTHRGVHPVDPEVSGEAEIVDREDLEAIGYIH